MQSKQLSKNTSQGWLLFIILALIWGSAFFLIKRGLLSFSPIEGAFIRVGIAGIILLPYALLKIKEVNSREWPYVIISGFLGSLIPAFLFARAQQSVESSTAGVLSALTPLFSVLISVIFFRLKYSFIQYLGLCLGFASAVFLVIFKNGRIAFDQIEGLLILLATLCYAANLNLLKYKLPHLDSRIISAGSLLFTTPVCLGYIFWNDSFAKVQTTADWQSLWALVILGVTSTAVALLLFNKLLKIASPMFASAITYAIPVIALGWGMLDGELLTYEMILSVFGIFISLYLINRKS